MIMTCYHRDSTINDGRVEDLARMNDGTIDQTNADDMDLDDFHGRPRV